MSPELATRAGMATMPGRERCVDLAVRSILGQVDEVHLALNGGVPAIDLPESRVIQTSTNSDDRAKFAAAVGFRGVFVTLDDDILYPPGYVERLAARVQSDPATPVGFHGSVLLPSFEDYYAPEGSREIHRYFDECAADVPVDVIGTGTLAFNPEAIGFDPSWLATRGLTDLEFSAALRERGIRSIVLAHPAGWIRPVQAALRGPSISGMSRGRGGGSLDVRDAANALVRERFTIPT